MSKPDKSIGGRLLLSVREAAVLLDKSPRTVRGWLVSGRLRGRKDGGQWKIDRRHLPLTAERHRDLQARAQEIRDAVDVALPSRAAGRWETKRRSILDVAAFRVAIEARGLLLEAGADLPGSMEAVHAIGEGAVALSEAWHQYDPTARLEALTRVRGAWARAAGVLLLHGGSPLSSPALEVVERLEQEAIPALAGLFRRTERARNGRARS